MNRQIELKVKSNSYVIEFPNVGKFQQIETMKQIISKGMYSSLLSMNTISSVEVLNMIDIESYLTVLVKDNQLMKDLKCSTFSDLGLEDYLELKKVYDETFVPWWSGIIKLLSPNKEQ